MEVAGGWGLKLGSCSRTKSFIEGQIQEMQSFWGVEREQD